MVFKNALNRSKTDSKSVCAQAHVGSNPTLSVGETPVITRFAGVSFRISEPINQRKTRVNTYGNIQVIYTKLPHIYDEFVKNKDNVLVKPGYSNPKTFQ